MSGLELNTASLVLAALLLLVAFLYSRALEAAEPDVHPLALARQAAVSRVRASSQETAVYRHRFAPHGMPLLAGSRGVVTLYDAFHEGLNGARNKPYLGRRPVPGAPYTWESYEEISERVTNFGSGLLRLADLRPGQFSKNFLGIFMTDSPEWLVADLACGFYGLCACPLYDATGRETVKRILGKTCLTALVTSRKHLAGLLEAKPDAAWLKLLVLVDGDAAAEEEDRAKKLGVELVAFGRVEEIGSANRRPHIPPKPEDVATLCWTGGTTGEPKGAMIMHRNLVAAFSSVLQHVPPNSKFTSSVVHFSSLPLAHIFERTISYAVTYLGGSVGFSDGDPHHIFDDAEVLRPTVYVGGPGDLKRFRQGVIDSVSVKGWFGKKAFWRAYRSKGEALRRGRLAKDGCWGRIAFSPFRRNLGGRMEVVFSPVPIDATHQEFCRIVLGCQVLQGYGQAESTGVATLASYYDYGSYGGSHVGPPLPCNEIKLRDVAEMSHCARDEPNPRGEVCIRGHSVFGGYFGDTARTADVLSSDGWLATGDVGEWLPNGTLKIIGRKHSMFKPSRGEFVGPEKVERSLTSSRLINQAFVYGEPDRPGLVAVIVPDEEGLAAVTAFRTLASPLAGMCRDERVQELMNSELRRTSDDAGLAEYERPRAVTLWPEPFTVGGALLTPTFELRREAARERFRKEIDEMYRNF